MQIYARQCRILGQVLSKQGMHTFEGKLEAILNMPPPNSQRNVSLFLGIANHCGKFMPFVETLSTPMN